MHYAQFNNFTRYTLWEYSIFIFELDGKTCNNFDKKTMNLTGDKNWCLFESTF